MPPSRSLKLSAQPTISFRRTKKTASAKGKGKARPKSPTPIIESSSDTDFAEEIGDVPDPSVLTESQFARYHHQITHAGKFGRIKPIHREEESRIDAILRHFDLSYEYGPCIGMTRLERWNRADKLDLDPPIEVKQILDTREAHTNEAYRENVFYFEKV